jgi:hypothetical protein
VHRRVAVLLIGGTIVEDMTLDPNRKTVFESRAKQLGQSGTLLAIFPLNPHWENRTLISLIQNAILLSVLSRLFIDITLGLL